MRFIRVSIFTLTVLFVQSLYANEERRFDVDIQGLQYQVVVTENTQITSKVSGVDEALLGHHYIAELEGEESSWVRASLIEGQWQGVVSVHNAMHVIQHDGGDISGGDVAATNTIVASMPVTEVDGLQGTCGRGDGNDTMLDHMGKQFAVNVIGRAAIAPSPLAETFAQFCNQEVNGICVIAEIEIAFDQAFQAVFGAQATAQAMSVLNIVYGHYMNDPKI